MNEPQPARAKDRHPAHHWLLASFCIAIVMALGWAFRLEQAMMGQYLPIVEMIDTIQVETLTAHLLFEGSLGGKHSDTKPGEGLAVSHLGGAQRNVIAMLDGQDSTEKRFLSLTDNPDWQRQVRDLQEKLVSWRQVIEQRTMTASGTELDRQLTLQCHDLFIEITHDLSALTNHLHTLTTAQMRKMRMVQATLLAIGLGLIILVVKIFRHLVRAQLVETQEQIELLSLGAEINAALTQNNTFREMLEACCSLLVSHLGAAFARIWVMQEDDDRMLELQASAGMYTRIDGPSRLKAVDESNKIGAIALSKLPYFSNQLIGDPQIIHQDWVKREKMVAFAGHPLMIGEEVIGVLAMFSCHPLSSLVQKMLASIADSIALAIDNKKAVLHLQQSRERYRELIENISDWSWTVDTNGVYTYSSPQVSRMLGYDAHEVIGRTPFSLMPEAEAERVEKIFNDIAAKQQPFAGLENVNLHQDGHKVILETSGSPIFDEHGHFKGYLGLDRDVTARKAAESAVLDQKRMLEAIFNAVPDAMIFTNTEHHAKLTNHGFSKLFGYTDQELLEHDISLLYDRLEDFTLPAPPLSLPPHGHQQPLPLEINFKRKNGEVFPGETVGAAIKNTAGEAVGFLFLVRDISQRKQMEASQRHTQKMEALGTLSGGIAHDFNNLLNVIGGYTALSIDDLDKDSPAAKNLQEVAKASERAAALVRQILAFSKGIEEGRNPLFLHHISKEVAKLMAGTLPATIEIKQDIDSRCRAVMADASHVHQVLMNLCTNAYHAMRESGGVLEIRLSEEEVLLGKIADLPAGPYAKLIVADTGHGMEQAVQDRIFEPYFTTKKKGEGSGLGLATVHGIITAHGGHITVKSETGKGSAFTIYLPIINQAAGPELEKAAEEELVLEQLKANILYVDDVAFNVALGEKILTRAGCQVTGETDSTAALTLFAAAPECFDLVITDQTMPKLTGIDLAREMLAIRPGLPIIMVTGHSDTVDQEKAKAVGIREFLPKPLGIEQLVSTVGRILRQPGLNQAPSDLPQPTFQHNRRAEDKAKVPASLDAVRIHLDTNYGVGPEQIEIMLKGMQETLRSEIDKARTAARQSDLKTLGLTAHTIKGLLLNAGLIAWADQAEAIEISAKNDAAKDYDVMLDELEQGLAPLLN